MASNYTRRV